MFEFTIEKQLSKRGRTGVLKTPHGDIKTPVFMPVGTQASVKSLAPADLEAIGAQIILANNYHLYLRPGSETVAKLGGIHQFMHWQRPVLTDSGGFQVWSLGKSLLKVSDEGIQFKSHIDGKTHFWSPEDAIASEQLIGADIIMAFDQCTNDTATLTEARLALERTERWLERCKTSWTNRSTQALFGIVQGAYYKDLRRQATQFVVDQDLPGIAIGGETIGYEMNKTEEVLDWIYDLLPENKPRYTMGVGLRPSDLTRMIACGIDMFDCVAPTRLARNGALYVSLEESATERIDISKSEFALDTKPIAKDCDCPTCRDFTRAYLHHLFKAKELLFYRLASMHNLRMMIKTVEDFINLPTLH